MFGPWLYSSGSLPGLGTTLGNDFFLSFLKLSSQPLSSALKEARAACEGVGSSECGGKTGAVALCESAEQGGGQGI